MRIAIVEGVALVDGLDQVIDLLGRQGETSRPLQLVAAIDEDPGEATLGVNGGKQGLAAPGVRSSTPVVPSESTTNRHQSCTYSTSMKTGIPSAPIEKIRRHYRQASRPALQ